MEKRRFTKEEFVAVQNLVKRDYIKTVTEKTADGIYNFRGVQNVAIWGAHPVMTGKKLDKRQIVFNFCVGSHNLKVGGEYCADAYSRHLRVETGTTDVDTRKSKK